MHIVPMSAARSNAVARVAAGLLAAVLAGAVPLPVHAAKPSLPSTAADTLPVARVTVPQAQLAIARGEAVLVDVRGSAQRSLGHARDDIGMPVDELTARLKDLPAAKRWVFYCSCPHEELALDAARIAMRADHAKVAALVGGYEAWRAAGAPIQVDESWEEAFRVDDPPSGWGKTPIDSSRCRYALDDSTAGAGRASGRITCVPAAESRGFAGFTQRIDALNLRGRRVTLSAKVRSENVERVAFLWMAAEDASGRMMALTPPDADPVKGTTGWHEVQISGVVPPVAVRVSVGLSLTSAGRVWLDDVRMVAEEEPGLPRVRIVIVNHGFEE
jgi:rhodanese-related sulfurtransferase